MRSYAIAAGVLLITGCATGPRPYDGVLGYRIESQPAGLQVIYVDEAKISAERTLAHITKVCGAKLGLASSVPHVQVLSETPFEQQVNMSIAIPVGMQSTGSQKSNAGSGSGPVMQNSVSQTEGVVRTMKLKKVVALCSAAP